MPRNEAADDHDRHPVFEAEQQLDELARADHLGDQIEGHDDQRARGREGADRRLLEAVAGHVGEGELAEVAQAFGHQEGDDGPADEEADRVDQAVVAGGHHRGGDAEERRGRHVVARDRQAVLEARDATAGGVEVRRGPGAGRGPLGDPQRREDEDREHRDCGPVGLLLGDLAHVGAGGQCRAGGEQREGGECEALHLTSSFRIWAVSASNSVFARRT